MYRVNKIHFDPNFSQPLYTWHDRPYLLTLAEHGKAAIIKQPLVNYRIHAAQVSQEKINEQHLQSIKKMFVIYFSYLSKPVSKLHERLYYGNATYAVLSFYLLRGAGFAETKQHLKDPLVRLSALSFKQWLLLAKFYFL
jgi:hypothetical protein